MVVLCEIMGCNEGNAILPLPLRGVKKKSKLFLFAGRLPEL
jgi:hypothetical protein